MLDAVRCHHSACNGNPYVGGGNLPPDSNRFRGVVYSYAAAIVYIPAYIILYNLFGADLSLLGIYLPMLVVEPP